MNIYDKRWKIETAFDFLKNVIQIENFTARRELLIKQDFYASILFYNISITLKQHVEYSKRASNKLKEDWAINYKCNSGNSENRTLEHTITIIKLANNGKTKINMQST